MYYTDQFFSSGKCKITQHYIHPRNVILRIVTTPWILPEKGRHQPKSGGYFLGSTKSHSFITTQEGDIKMLVTSLRMLPDI
jgi:hypothetical protein